MVEVDHFLQFCNFSLIFILGTRAEYKITWFDPKGPTIPHPDTNDPLTERYCNEITKANYKGDPEPTRQPKNGENEDCVTVVFLPQPNSRGHICMADDYCSTKMSYICELSKYQLIKSVTDTVLISLYS